MLRFTRVEVIGYSVFAALFWTLCGGIDGFDRLPSPRTSVLLLIALFGLAYLLDRFWERRSPSKRA